MAYLIERRTGMPPHYGLRDTQAGRFKPITAHGTVYDALDERVLAVILRGGDPHITPEAALDRLAPGVEVHGILREITDAQAREHEASAPAPAPAPRKLTREERLTAETGHCPDCGRALLSPTTIDEIEKGLKIVDGILLHPIAGKHAPESCTAKLTVAGAGARESAVSQKQLDDAIAVVVKLRAEYETVRTRHQAIVARNPRVARNMTSQAFKRVPQALDSALAALAAAKSKPTRERKYDFAEAEGAIGEARHAIGEVAKWAKADEAAHAEESKRKAAMAGTTVTREKAEPAHDSRRRRRNPVTGDE